MAKKYFAYEFTEKEFKELLGIDKKDTEIEVFVYPHKVVVTVVGPQ